MHYVERVARIILGYGLIFSVAFQPVPLDYLLILPLIAIYPSLTGIVGWDPFYALFEINSESAEKGMEMNTPYMGASPAASAV